MNPKITFLESWSLYVSVLCITQKAITVETINLVSYVCIMGGFQLEIFHEEWTKTLCKGIRKRDLTQEF